jgi:hypothetical protein
MPLTLGADRLGSRGSDAERLPPLRGRRTQRHASCAKPRSQVSSSLSIVVLRSRSGCILACFGEKRESCTLFCWLKPNETVRISKTPARGLNLHLLVLQCLKDRFQACNEAMGSSDGASGCSCTAHGRASRPWIWGDAAAVSRRRSRLESPLCVTRLWD